MSDWGTVLLVVIAITTVAMAIAQVSLLVYAWHLGRRVGALSSRVEQDLRPILAAVQAVSSDAARVSGLAAAQAERLDRVAADLVRRVDETAIVLQQGLIAPVREGRAAIAAILAIVAALRDIRSRPARSAAAADEDAALFIG